MCIISSVCLDNCELVSEILSKELPNYLPPVVTTDPERRGFSAPESGNKVDFS